MGGAELGRKRGVARRYSRPDDQPRLSRAASNAMILGLAAVQKTNVAELVDGSGKSTDLIRPMAAFAQECCLILAYASSKSRVQAALDEVLVENRTQIC
ncbi:MAG: hypothetical protein WDM92_08910 [Caulobacteraceae bacterium]